MFGKYGKMKVYKCYYINGVRIFEREKKNLKLPSLGFFLLNGEKKIREWSLNNIIEESYQIEDN